ncbi:MAG: hypothetical protein QNJ29_13690 [Rhizobiaceae bacterium]|nr:hypothetical protein [Rhizobiaceae bacterium]
MTAALCSCAASPAVKKIHGPIKSLHAAEVPFLIDVCHAHLFRERNATTMLMNGGYENKPYPVGPAGYPYSKSVGEFTLYAYAAIGFEDPNVCSIQIHSNAGGGPVSSHLKQKLSSMGYQPIGQEKYGTFNNLTRAILSNGTNTITFTGRKRTQNASSTNTIVLTKR